MKGKSLRASINAMCRACTADPANAGSAAAQVKACTVTTCPLWRVRPAKALFGPAIRAELEEHLTPAQIDRWEAHPYEAPEAFS